MHVNKKGSLGCAAQGCLEGSVLTWGVTLTSIFSPYQICCCLQIRLGSFSPFSHGSISPSVRAFPGQNFHPCFWMPTILSGVAGRWRQAEPIPAGRPYGGVGVTAQLYQLGRVKGCGDAEHFFDPSVSIQHSVNGLRSSSLKKAFTTHLVRRSVRNSYKGELCKMRHLQSLTYIQSCICLCLYIQLWDF